MPLFLAVIGTGMVGGSLFGGWFADRGLLRAIGVILALNILVLAALPFTASSPTFVGIKLFLVGFAALSLAPALQTRLMNVAGPAQTLAASLNYSAFNIADALGAWLGGVCIAAAFNWTYTGPLGACLATGGPMILLASRRAERRSKAPLQSGR